MRLDARAALGALLLLLPGCSPAPAIDCSTPPAGFVRLDRLPATREPHLVNTIRIDETGAIYWNGTALNRSTDRSAYDILDQYLATTASLTPQWITAVAFRNGAPCASLTHVRSLMEKRLACSTTDDICVQGEMPGYSG
jgi:hypothetical protein